MTQAPLVTLIPGNLIGRDLAGPAVELVCAAGGRIEWEWIEEERGEDLADAAIASIRRTGIALQGPMNAPIRGGYELPTVKIRKALGLFGGIRITHNLRGVPSRYEDVDLVIIRENTEDVYAGLEHKVHRGVVESIKVVTREASERIFRFGYDYAQRHGRQRIAIIHKANIMKLSDGLFLRVGREVAEDYPDIETRELIVDNTCQQLVQDPWQFDVLICPNLYGDIISDLAAGIVGGICATVGVSQGKDAILFECIHGRVPELMGKDTANPVPMILPCIKLLRHLGQGEAADRLRLAIEDTLVDGTHLTRDMGGNASTSETVAAIGKRLQ